MKAQNEKQRNDLFIKTLLLFTLTFIILFIAAFFDLLIPGKADDIDRDKVAQFDQLTQHQSNILSQLDSANFHLTHYNNINYATMGSLISEDINNIKNQNTDSNSIRLYKKIGILMGNFRTSQDKSIGLSNELAAVQKAKANDQLTIGRIKSYIADYNPPTADPAYGNLRNNINQELDKLNHQ